MNEPKTWQIASGDTGRDYSGLFLQHDLMFMGPGQWGEYEDERYSGAVARGEVTSKKTGMVRSFVQDVTPDDLVLLRKGHRVVAIGLVVDEEGGCHGYQYDDTFGDIFGWDLQHTRRVVWQGQLQDELIAIQRGGELFQSYKQQPTFTRVHQRDTLDRIASLIPRCVHRPLRPRPGPLPPELSLEEVGQRLFSKGLANNAVDNALRAIERQRRLLTWYYAQGETSSRPDEHEVVAHMVLPLLLALGWSEQLLAVEWKNVDLAAFWGTPTTAERCVLVCEAKRMRHGLQNVWEQAIGYIDKLGLRDCGKILLTQGARFYVYEKVADEWPTEAEPAGYINLERIRENHIAPMNTNAIDTLIALTPAGVRRTLRDAETISQAVERSG